MDFPMKVLVTGAKGQLGSEIIHILKTGSSSIGKINDAYLSAEILGTDKSTLDITNLNNMRKILGEFNPNIVINTAAYTNVDDCEVNQDLAFKINAIGGKNMAVVCEELGAKLIYLSTDYVFDGNCRTPYREYDSPSPINIYGKTKYLGELYVGQFSTRYFIIRTSWLYGYNGKNFVKTIMKSAAKKDYINVVDDQIGNPTNVEDLAYHILKVALTEDYGIYHCTGNGKCSWFEFACKIIELNKFNCKVNPIESKALGRIAKRPSYSSLDNSMLRCTVRDEMRQWEDALRVFINNINF